MPNKPIKKAKVITPDQIREDKKRQAMQFLAQRRESYAVNILCSLVQGKDMTEYDGCGLVNIAVSMADHLITRLYPVNEDTDTAND